MDSFYKTSINIIKNPLLTEIPQTEIKTNIPIQTSNNINSKKSSLAKNISIFEKRKKQLNILFPYHLFSIFPISLEKHLAKNSNNILLKIKRFKDILKKDEDILQKNIDLDKEEFLKKLDYQPSDFFLKFAKKRSGIIKKEKEILKKKYSNLKIKFKNKQKLKKVTFSDIIINPRDNKKKSKTCIKNNHMLTIDNSENSENERKKTIFENILKNRNKPPYLNIAHTKSYDRKNNIFPTVINLKRKNVKFENENKNENNNKKINLKNFLHYNSLNNNNCNTNRNNKINIAFKSNKENIMNNKNNNPYNLKYYHYSSMKNFFNTKKVLRNTNINT